MEVKIPDNLKSEIPQNTWGKILTSTPIVMAVISTMLAGLSSSEMSQAQYDRSLGAQQQSKAGDQWNFFQAKRLRSAMQRESLDLLYAGGEVNSFDPGTLRAMLQSNSTPQTAEILARIEPATLATLAEGKLPKAKAAPPLNAGVQSAIDAVANGRSETEIRAILKNVTDAQLEETLAAAEDQTRQFDAVTKPASQAIDQLDDLLGRSPALARQNRDFMAARMRFNALRYDGDARLNQTVAYIYELKVHRSNMSADRRRARSQQFFYGMLAAQIAVIISTFAIAARQRNLLWSLAAGAGLIAVILSLYVWLRV